MKRRYVPDRRLNSDAMAHLQRHSLRTSIVDEIYESQFSETVSAAHPLGLYEIGADDILYVMYASSSLGASNVQEGYNN